MTAKAAIASVECYVAYCVMFWAYQVKILSQNNNKIKIRMWSSGAIKPTQT